MIEAILTAALGFGAAAFCFSAGLVIGATRNSGANTFPATHVSFEAGLTTEQRLSFLASVAESVKAGQVGEPTPVEQPGGRQ
ncbi:hypothetical protein QU617_18780 [Pseudomonas guariconensis]|jgi:hypothetical protein|uniref:hypothetical protein n=1 Tax=Pseudomonas guariconensis TaxID=1288410 RepID=UPI0025A9B4EE|nr:hypothetical protein [Pseudomonas guariconensis]MDM9595336.1 hypothetical protein [Pseudomonas guariconensis]MDM9608166.1 hypothetical protein [Pseudomonas guariconensis]MDM9613123.1 hypothetical protein [Pseudomonas guariconensis]MEB3843416.1 hypothetical protein [Pseudomonas guariconensis]MEB3876284.1 hypothetical protein [Pseudomonas guariconensis]